MMWIAYGLAGLVPATSFVLFIVETVIRPRLIPPEEIEALADAMERAHPDDPDYGAFVQEEAAWFRSDGFARGRWLRVRKRLRERMAQRP